MFKSVSSIDQDGFHLSRLESGTGATSHYDSNDGRDHNQHDHLRRIRIKGFRQLRNLLMLATSTADDANDTELIDGFMQRMQNLPLDREITTVEYREAVNRLSQMAVVKNPDIYFENLIFMTRSSSLFCNLYTCNRISNMDDRYVMKVTQLKNRDVVMEVENELRLTTKCKHDNIIQIHQILAFQENIYQVTKYCKYGTLTKLIFHIRELTEQQIAFISYQILLAIDHLHREQHIMHLDIKSENILVDENFNFMVSDFGLSVQTEDENGTFNDIRGTPYWIAPEMLTDPCYNSKVDIWSFGIVVWEMMHEGSTPYSHVNNTARVLESIKRTYPRLEMGHSWSPDLSDFLYKMLNKKPSERWSASQLLHHDFLVKNVDWGKDHAELAKQLFFSHVNDTIMM